MDFLRPGFSKPGFRRALVLDSPRVIVHVIHHLVIGGMENGVVNLVNRMDAARYRHAVICMEDFSEFRHRIADSSVPVTAMHKSTLSTMALYRRVFSTLRALRPAIVHTRNLSGLDALLPAMLAGVHIRVHSEHGWDVGDLRGAALKPRLLRKLHSPMVNQYVTVSKDLQRYLTNRVGIAATRIKQIYNGVDTGKFAPAALKPDGVLPDSLAGNDKIIVGTVGRLQPVKNQMALVRDFARIVREQPALRSTLRLAIVGDGRARQALVDCVNAEQIAELTWMPGARHDVAQVLKCLDVFVLPSLNEGISNTILEAMATGLPVVASNVGGNSELVTDHVTGMLYDVERPQGLYLALQPYLTDRELRRRHGAAGRLQVEKEFNIDTMVGRYQALYDGLLQCAA